MFLRVSSTTTVGYEHGRIHKSGDSCRWGKGPIAKNLTLSTRVSETVYNLYTTLSMNHDVNNPLTIITSCSC